MMSDPYLDDLEFANKANIEAARKFKAERDALDLSEAVRLLDALLGLERGSGAAALLFVESHPIEKIEGGAS